MAQTEESKSSVPFSLIKYEAEIQVSDNIESYQKAKNNQKVLDLKPSPEDVLNNMIPPRDWTTPDNKRFMQYVSHQKTEREDVTRLKDSLQQALQHRQARTHGICPIREELFSQGFDEVIRQVTINCPERGVLLMRVRDEHKMTLAAYQTLYQYSVSFGVRKQLEAEEGMDELQEELGEAQRQRDELSKRRIQLESKKKALEKKIKERKLLESEDQVEENSMIEEQKQQLQKFLAFLKEVKME